MDQLAAHIAPSPSSQNSHSGASPRVALSQLRQCCASRPTLSSTSAAVSTTVKPLDSPTSNSATGSADEVNVVERLDKLDLTDPQRKAARGYKNVPTLEAIAKLFQDKPTGSKTPDSERSKEEALLQVSPANTPRKEHLASEKSKEHPSLT